MKRILRLISFTLLLVVMMSVVVSADTSTEELTFTEQPADASVTLGTPVAFSVTVTGKAPLTYQWQSRKNADSAWANSAVSGAKTSGISLTPTAGYDGYQFRCVVTDGNGAKAYSDEATITILPKITSQPKNVSVTVGSTANFSIVATGKATLKYQWQSRRNSDSAWANSGVSGAKTASISLTPTAGYDGYQFRCVVTGGNGQVAYSDAATITILPNITSQPQNVSVTVGSTAKFTVAATGKATLSYQWQSRKNADSAWANSGVSGAKTASISLTPTAGYHGYQFRCVVTDGRGQKLYSDPATLSILPTITTQPQNASVKSGVVATFSVAASGKAPFTYQWQSRKNSDATWANSGLSTAKEATLSVTASPGMAGYQFRCLVTDSNGQKVYSKGAVMSVLLNITSQPKNASATVGSTAKFTVVATGKATLSYQWQSRKNADAAWANSGLSTAKDATLVVTASAGLDGYQFRCAVTDGYGKTAYSNAATLSVNLSITSQPQNVSAAVGSTAKFTVAAAGKATLSYQWQSRKDASSSWANSGLSSAKSATLSVNVTAGLDGYQFRCVVTDGNGKKVYSNVATLTIPLVITTQPQNVGTEVGKTVKYSITATGAGTISYQWQTRKNASSDWTNCGYSGSKTATLSVTTSDTLDGYQFRCVVTDGNGKKAYSNAVTLDIQLIPGLVLPKGSVTIEESYITYSLSDMTYAIEGSGKNTKLKWRVLVTMLKPDSQRLYPMWSVRFYDKNGVLLITKLCYVKIYEMGEKGYGEGSVLLSEIEDATYAKFARR